MIEALPNQIMVGLLPLVGISLGIKTAIRKLHPQYGEKRIEVCHIQDRFKDGTDTEDNLVGLSVGEHIADHVLKAMNETDKKNIFRQYGAASLIAKRATPEEIEEANRLLSQLPRRR